MTGNDDVSVTVQRESSKGKPRKPNARQRPAQPAVVASLALFSLFERSKTVRAAGACHFRYAVSNQLITQVTLMALQIPVGTDPVKLLLWKYAFEMFFQFSIDFGIVPVKAFS
jgi:hypothetical protein